MKISFYIVNAFRFIAEVMTFIILVVYGLKITFPYNLFFGILLPIIFLFVWGIFIAPKAKIKLSLLPKFLIEIIIFATAYLIYRQFSITNFPVLFFIYAITTSICSKITDNFLGIK